MERELRISRKVIQELSKMLKALIETSTQWQGLKLFFHLVRRGACLIGFLFELETRSVSKPIVSSKGRGSCCWS